MKDLTSSSSSSIATVTTGFCDLRMAGSTYYVEYNVVDGVSEITVAYLADGNPSIFMTMERLNERLAEQLADEAQA